MIKLFIKPFKSIPVIGAIIDTLEGVIYGWLEAKQNIQHKNNIIIINDIFHRKVGIKDLDDILKKIAITITQARKDEIINPKAIPNHNSLTQKLQNCVRAAGDIIYDKAKNILLPEIIEGCDKDNTAVQLALKDSIAFINYLYTNYNNILNNDFDLLEQCKNIVENSTLDGLSAKNT